MSGAANLINSLFGGFDMSVFRIFGGIQNEVLTVIANAVTHLGGVEAVAAVLFISIILCFFKKTRKIGICVLCSVAVGAIITNIILKPLIMRPRPYVYFADNPEFTAWYTAAGSLFESDFSFPSGHTTSAFSYCIALFLCLRERKNKVAYLFPFIAVAVMLTRVYLMVHYASDVIFGMIIGIASAAASYAFVNALKSGKIKIPKLGEII